MGDKKGGTRDRIIVVSYTREQRGQRGGNINKLAQVSSEGKEDM